MQVLRQLQFSLFFPRGNDHLFDVCSCYSRRHRHCCSVWLPQLQARLLRGNAAVLVVLHSLLGEGRQGGEREQEEHVVPQTGHLRSQEIHFSGSFWQLAVSLQLCALHFPFEKRKIFINIQVLCYLHIYIGFGGNIHMYIFSIKELLPIPQLLLTLSQIKSHVPPAWYVLLPTSLKLTAEVQKGKTKQVDVGITCIQENDRKLGLEGI